MWAALSDACHVLARSFQVLLLCSHADDQNAMCWRAVSKCCFCARIPMISMACVGVLFPSAASVLAGG